MKRAFLDANVLFSAAYTEQSSLLDLWKLTGIRLGTSKYAIEEAQRNLRSESGEARLRLLAEALLVIPEADARLIPASIQLRDKDKPILAAAIAARAAFLVTGDRRDFGHFFANIISGVLVVRPSDLIAVIEEEQQSTTAFVGGE